jgi:hypothetical protein
MSASRRAALVFVGLALFFFGLAIFGDRTVYTGDLECFIGPRDRFLASSIANGDGIPQWAPGIFGGAPGLASQEFGFLYPPNFLLALLAGDRAKAIGLALHFVLGAFGVLALARRLGASEGAALLSGTAFMFGGAVVCAHVAPPYVVSAAWTAWAAWAALGMARRQGGVAVATIAFLSIFLEGEPFGCPLAALVAFGVVLVSEDLFGVARTIAFLGLAAVLSMLLGAAQLFPSFAVLDETARAKGITFALASEWSFWPGEALGFLVPFAFGHHANPPSVWIDAVFPDGKRAWAEAYYLGPVVLALALVGVTRLKESALARAGTALVLGATPLALGKFTPVFKLFYDFAPGGKFLRYPAKLMVFAALGAALLAASGLDGLGKRTKLAVSALSAFLAASLLALLYVHFDAADLGASIDALGVPRVKGLAAIENLEPRLLHVAVFALGGLLVLLRPRGRKEAALLALVVLDLGLTLRPAVYLAPREPFERAPRVAPVLAEVSKEDGFPARVIGTEGARALAPEDERSAGFPGDYDLARVEGLEPDAGLGEGVLDQQGFLSNPPFRFALMALRLGKLPAVDQAIRLGARYLLVQNEDLGREATLVRTVGSRSLLRLERSPPWASLHGNVTYAKGEDASKKRFDAARLASVPSFDPRRDCVIEAAEQPCDPGARGSVRLASRFGLQAFDLDVETSGPSWLVVREAWASGWTATVDGAPAEIAPADVLFRAVHLPAGAKRVAFRFAAPRAREGAIVSLVTAFSLLLLVLRRRVNRDPVRV